MTIPRIDGRKGDLDEHFGFPADAGLNLKNSAVFGKPVVRHSAKKLLAKHGASFNLDAAPHFERDFASLRQTGALTPLRAATQAAVAAAASATG